MDLPIAEISDFPNHPFKVRMDDAMTEMAESVKQYGVLVPALVRPLPDGGYQMVAGHRRKRASELAGRETLSCIVRDLTDEEATIIMVDSNLQREQVGESKDQIRRYIRLTSLIPELLDMVDNSVLKESGTLQMALRPAVELSCLTADEQRNLLETMLSQVCTPSHAQAIKMRDFSEKGKLNADVILSIMEEEKPNQVEQFKIPKERIAKFFSPGTPAQKMEDTIVKALELYRKRQRDMGR